MSAARAQVVLLVLAVAGAARAADDVARARTLAQGGAREQALALLDDRLRAAPDDRDALVLKGTVLAWQGRYDEARECLDRVLAESPAHYDALRASVNLELWSDHPARAEELARAGLERDPDSPDLLLARAQALRALDRLDEADAELDELLRVAPGDDRALALRDRLADTRRVWEVALRWYHDRFDDGRDDWDEEVVSLSRRFGFGRVAFRYYHAQHWGDVGDQLELEAFPSLRDGTYLDVGVAVSPNSVNYPGYRLQLDVYQSLGGGFEASVGYRHLAFTSGVDIFVASLTKYLGNWMLTGRSFITPDDTGVSVSGQVTVRRYFGAAGSYVGLRYGHGVSREEIVSSADIAALASDTFAAEVNLDLGWASLLVGASYSRGERAGQSDLGDWTFAAGTGYRF